MNMACSGDSEDTGLAGGLGRAAEDTVGWSLVIGTMQ